MKIMKSLEYWLNAKEERKRKNNPDYAKMREQEEIFLRKPDKIEKIRNCFDVQWTPAELRLMQNNKRYVSTYGCTAIYKTDEEIEMSKRDEIRNRMLKEMATENVGAVDAAMKALEELGLLVPEKPPELTAADVASTTMIEINSPEIGIFKRGYLTEYGWNCIVEKLRNNGFVIVNANPANVYDKDKFPKIYFDWKDTSRCAAIKVEEIQAGFRVWVADKIVYQSWVK